MTKTNNKIPLTQIVIALVLLLFIVGVVSVVGYVNSSVPVLAGTKTKSGLVVQAKAYGLMSGGIGVEDNDNGVLVLIGGQRIAIDDRAVSINRERAIEIDQGNETLDIIYQSGKLEFFIDGKAILPKFGQLMDANGV